MKLMKPTIMSRILPCGDGHRDEVCQNVPIHWLKITKSKGTNVFHLKHDKTLHVGLFKNPKNQP